MLIKQVNNTNHDWPIEAQLEGAGFVGPQTLMAKAQTTSLYPLVFRPSFEGPVKVAKGILLFKEL